MLKKYLHHLSNKQIRWDYKFIKKTQFMIVSQKPYDEYEYVKLVTCNFEIVKDHTYLGPILKINMN